MPNQQNNDSHKPGTIKFFMRDISLNNILKDFKVDNSYNRVFSVLDISKQTFFNNCENIITSSKSNKIDINKTRDSVSKALGAIY